ncbi:hypothetical protein Scep_000064 [Stephania cephalantha]|uniref:Uncharacterized protein n=1 Tax=Stephania cephalantha TaxID=152367 RepID=A0AAP0Q2L5_9MAGN
MAHLKSLREIDVSFNELESVPECLCVCTTLVKMNVSSNFADLRSLPRGLGNLEMLEELNIANNQIRFLPESFGMLSNLKVFKADQNPLEVPPMSVVEKEAQAVVQYMTEYVTRGSNAPLPRHPAVDNSMETDSVTRPLI